MKATLNLSEELGRLEANAGHLLTAIQWLSNSLEAEAAHGNHFGLALAAQMGGPVRALSTALISLNYGVSELLAAAEADLRSKAEADIVESLPPSTVEVHGRSLLQ